jgi:hypothetical protein
MRSEPSRTNHLSMAPISEHFCPGNQAFNMSLWGDIWDLNHSTWALWSPLCACLLAGLAVRRGVRREEARGTVPREGQWGGAGRPVWAPDVGCGLGRGHITSKLLLPHLWPKPYDRWCLLCHHTGLKGSKEITACFPKVTKWSSSPKCLITLDGRTL